MIGPCRNMYVMIVHGRASAYTGTNINASVTPGIVCCTKYIPIADTIDASAQFFTFLAATLLSERAIVRLREPGASEPLLNEPLTALERCVSKIADGLDDGRERDEP